jgi:hypothetical protein
MFFKANHTTLELLKKQQSNQYFGETHHSTTHEKVLSIKGINDNEQNIHINI